MLKEIIRKERERRILNPQSLPERIKTDVSDVFVTFLDKYAVELSFSFRGAFKWHSRSIRIDAEELDVLTDKELADMVRKDIRRQFKNIPQGKGRALVLWLNTRLNKSELFNAPRDAWKRWEQLEDVEFGGVDPMDAPKYCDAYVESAALDGVPLTDKELDLLNEQSDTVHNMLYKYL